VAVRDNVVPLFPDEREPTPYWLTVSTYRSVCVDCGSKVKPGGELVFRHRPKTVLCRACADRMGVEYRPSRKWRERQRGAA
jgi:hypothetical protein